MTHWLMYILMNSNYGCAIAGNVDDQEMNSNKYDFAVSGLDFRVNIDWHELTAY